MKVTKRLLEYEKMHFNEVYHTTLNPEGPGVVRIHLIPPAISEDEIGSGVAIINGQDIIPVGPSWLVLLMELIDEVNKYEGREISPQEVESIIDCACKRTKKVFPLVPKFILRQDMARIMTTFKQVAYREPVDEAIGYMTMGEYASYMRAPHRMDLMISAMTLEGRWHCNQKCVHCYAAGQTCSDEAELSTAQWKEILDRCRAAGIPQVTFTGGEPTMREDLPELVEHARWFVTRLNTNGINMTKALCSSLREASLDSCQITFYSCDPQVHNALVGAARFEDTVRGMRNTLEAGISLSVNTPLCTLNKDYVKTLEFLHNEGVLYVTCSGLITTGNAQLEASEKLQLTTDELKGILKEAVDYCFSHGMEISFTSPGWIEDSYFAALGINTPSCGACLSNMAITPGGHVVPCQSWLSGRSLGNMLTDDWQEIWESNACWTRRDYSAQMLGKCPLRKMTDPSDQTCADTSSVPVSAFEEGGRS